MSTAPPTNKPAVKEKASPTGTPGAEHDLQLSSGPAESLDESDVPTDEEYKVLRKVPAAMPWVAIAMCIVELAERASYHGTRKAFANFVRGALPKGGNGLGAVAKGAAGANQTSGALGLGSVPASAIGSTFTFLSYVIPIFGGILADTKWGRFKTIFLGVIIGFFGHVFLVIPALPGVITHQAALAPFIIGLIILAFGAGFIKPSLGPLLCDQSPVQRPTLTTLKSGERVILDPQATVQRYFLIFYWCINVGAFWQLVTSYTERLVGFWLAFLLPTAIYLIVPAVFLYARKRLYFAPPQGSVVLESFYVIREIFKRNGLQVFRGGDAVWDTAKPSVILKTDGQIDETRYFWDDQFVEEIRQSVNACSVSWVLVVFYLADGFIGNMVNDASAAMVLNHIPNDITGNFNPLSIIIATPIITYGLYPLFERFGRPIQPTARLSIGFALAMGASIFGAIVQWKIYSTSPCGWYATDCPAGVSSVSLAWQIPQVILPAVGEVFVSVTSYELAYTRAPARMKSLVYAIVLFNQAIVAAIGLALSGVIRDPWLIWPYVALAAANFLCIFWVPWYFRHLNEPLKSFADRARQAGKKEQVVGLVQEGAGEFCERGRGRGREAREEGGVREREEDGRDGEKV